MSSASIPIVQRLVNGARILAALFRSGHQCEGGWTFACECAVKTKFCKAKGQWVALMLKQAADPGRSVEVAGADEEYALVVSMTLAEFNATGLTLEIETASGQRIKVGANGTRPETFLELDDELLRAMEAVMRVFPAAVVTEVGTTK